ncbi:hypothetical protein [Nostoc sp. LPT]|uniref:hypothetical protein n=1 Tax=Nostoc sp. LPT TaxID=2815387 RepID=UPI0025DC4FA0|nr:hypothetical protein [Nostoc sp. LPT]
MMLEELLAESPVRDRLQYEGAIAFSELGDRLFDELADKIAIRRQYRLLFEHTLKPELFQQIRVAAAG